MNWLNGRVSVTEIYLIGISKNGSSFGYQLISGLRVFTQIHRLSERQLYVPLALLLAADLKLFVTIILLI